ncbi:Thiosulfate sulfurtransferase, rhodanese [hydrothermal vent metagenome]|uniref:Thiosulfate sulfurtransferase, rhodanese n=1 Tax=hydrothermal vent metagenome TaxID=652676 RepID=A0A3B0X455_9ZZZZ
MSQASHFIEPDDLEKLRSNENIIIVDLCKAKQYAQAHIPEAHFVNYADIVKIDKPVMGLLPDNENFSALLSSLGVTKKSLIVAYDDEGGGCAARFIWTLHVFGHETAVILNGGLHSWANEGHQLANEAPEKPKASNYTVSKTHHHTATRAFIQTRLEDDNVVFLDARSKPEYTGEKKFSEKAGRIPGAIHYEWTESMNQSNNLRRLPAENIQQQLDELGITKDKEVVCYCQSHHRSAYSWLVLKSLGYENVLGYPGSWSDWGNNPDTPVEL